LLREFYKYKSHEVRSSRRKEDGILQCELCLNFTTEIGLIYYKREIHLWRTQVSPFYDKVIHLVLLRNKRTATPFYSFTPDQFKTLNQHLALHKVVEQCHFAGSYELFRVTLSISLDSSLSTFVSLCNELFLVS